MLWYNGSIAEAVSLSKQRKAVFVVFIEGDNDGAREFASVFNNAEVSNKLSDENKFLVIKLKSGSVEYTQFAQIYQFVPVPSLFFIGKNGAPLEVVCTTMEPNVLCSRIDKVLVEHVKENDIKSQTQDLLQSEASTSSNVSAASGSSTAASPNLEVRTIKTPEEPNKNTPTPVVFLETEVVCEGGVYVRRPVYTRPTVPTSQQNIPEEPSTEQLVQEAAPPERPPSVDEKVERARELLEIKKREKEIKEKELAKEKELERRSTGQGVAQLKRWQAEQEYKQIQEERKREKLENDMAREKILKQIAQDRAERKAKEVPAGQEPETSPSAGTPVTGPARHEPVAAPHFSPPETCESARLQLKLPDGDTLTQTFRADDTLMHVHTYIITSTQLKKNSFSLWISFPRQELHTLGSTLRELQLVPSAALLVLPKSGTASVSTPTPFYSVISFLTSLFTTLIINPLTSIFTWIRSHVTPPPPAPGPPRGTPAPGPPRGPPAPGPPRAAPSPPPASPLAPGLRYRHPTNIHRLSDDANDDDDNNTWNGNSTQQM